MRGSNGPRWSNMQSVPLPLESTVFTTYSLGLNPMIRTAHAGR